MQYADCEMKTVTLLDIISQSLLAISSGTAGDTVADMRIRPIVSVFDILTGCSVHPEGISDLHVHGTIENDMKAFEENIQKVVACPHLKSALSYFVSELVCNIEQHAMVDIGYGFSIFDGDRNRLIIGIADGGISIYGSYVRLHKYLVEIGDSDAQALYLAQNGYSTKNRPDAENRGYGISSNSRMVVEGLNGIFAILSGNALYYHTPEGKRIFDLPENVVWPGTLVLAEIPISGKEFNIYDYIG